MGRKLNGANVLNVQKLGKVNATMLQGKVVSTEQHKKHSVLDDLTVGDESDYSSMWCC